MRKFFQFVKVVLLAGPAVIYYHIFYMCRYARHPEKYPIEKRYKVARKEIRFVINRFRPDYKVKNLDLFTNLNEKCLIISNHLAFQDPLSLISVSEKPLTFVCKKEVFKMPFVGKIAKAIDCFPLDRENLMNQITQIREIVSYLKDPNKPSVLIFIEGTRSKHPEDDPLEFHPGTLKIAQMAGVPIVVAATYGSFRVLDMKSYLRKYPVFYNLTRIIPKDEVKAQVTTEFALSLHKEITDEINSLRKEDRNYIESLKISKKHKALETAVDIRANS